MLGFLAHLGPWMAGRTELRRPWEEARAAGDLPQIESLLSRMRLTEEELLDVIRDCRARIEDHCEATIAGGEA